MRLDEFADVRVFSKRPFEGALVTRVRDRIDYHTALPRSENSDGLYVEEKEAEERRGDE